MKEFKFEKKGNNFKITVEGVTCKVNAYGLEANAVPNYHNKGGWVYKITDKKLIEKLTDAKMDIIYLVHETAKEAYHLINDAEKENLRQSILKSKKIKLSYCFGDWHRANAVFINDKPSNFGDAKNIFKNKKLHKVLGTYADTDKLKRRLDSYFTQNDEFITYKDEELATNVENMEGITVEIAEFDDMRGKGKYVSSIAFNDFETFEKYVVKALLGDMKKEDKNQEKLDKAEQEARTTGKNVKLYHHSAPCNDENEDCDVDIITVYMTPSGRTKTTRTHTY